MKIFYHITTFSLSFFFVSCGDSTQTRQIKDSREVSSERVFPITTIDNAAELTWETSSQRASESAIQADYDVVLKGRLSSLKYVNNATILTIHVPKQSIKDQFGGTGIIAMQRDAQGQEIPLIGNQTYVYPVQLTQPTIRITIPKMSYCPIKKSSEVEICMNEDGTISQILTYEGHYRPINERYPEYASVRNKPLQYIEYVSDDDQVYPVAPEAKPFEATRLTEVSDMLVLRQGRYYLRGFGKGPGASSLGWLAKKVPSEATSAE